jgi:hypothetical protein
MAAKNYVLNRYIDNGCSEKTNLFSGGSTKYRAIAKTFFYSVIV